MDPALVHCHTILRDRAKINCHTPHRHSRFFAGTVFSGFVRYKAGTTILKSRRILCGGGNCFVLYFGTQIVNENLDARTLTRLL